MPDAPQNTAPNGSHLDQLANLHRMSRTAGLGASEYSAVNVAAVVAVLIGLASALALMSSVFLFLPVVGTIIAVVAVKQIVGSNGTQTGLPLAILALVLSFGLAGFTGLKAYGEFHKVKSDTDAIDALVAEFGRLAAAKNYDAAYALTDDRFRDTVTKAQFQNLWEELAKAPPYGPLKGIRTTKLFAIDADPETGARMAAGFILIDTEKANGTDALRTDGRFRYLNDKWTVYAIPQLFAQQKPAAASNQPAGAAGPPSPR